MVIELIIFLVILALIGFLLFKIVKTLIKAIFVEVLLLAALLILLGIVMFIDLNDFRQNFMTSEKLFLFEKDNDLITGFSVSVFTDESTISPLNKEELEFYDNRYKINDLKSARGDYYKIIILKKEAFSELEEGIMVGKQNFSKSFIFDILEAEDAVEFLVQSQLPPEVPEDLKQDYRDTLGDADMLKAKMLAVLFVQSMVQESPVFLLEQFRKQNIIIYPESPMFKAVKFIPKSLKLDRLQKRGA